MAREKMFKFAYHSFTFGNFSKPKVILKNIQIRPKTYKNFYERNIPLKDCVQISWYENCYFFWNDYVQT